MKIAIIGAGINGLYLSWKFSEMGHKVKVFEKRNIIGKEACSGLFSERIFDFIPQSKKLIQNQINFALIHFPKKTVRVYFSRKFFIINHAELDRLVAGLAQNAGVQIKLNETGWNPVSFDRVIGCDGANSGVRKSLYLLEPEYRLGILGFVPEKDNSDFVETWPVENGFIWKIPKGNEIEYGVIANLNHARKFLDNFCRQNNLLLQNVKSALIPQGFIIPKDRKITLCGDAAGLTKPWSGGGVIWGLRASDILLKNFPDLLKYQRDAKKHFYFKITISKFLTKVVYFLGFNFPWLLPKRIKIDGDRLL